MSRARVVVLARAGAARERTEVAVREAGAELVTALDPLTVAEDAFQAAHADAVIVVLEPVIEQALEKFDAVLADPGLCVIFDEAELASSREGWEAARWARHLAAKLQGHANVLPAAPGKGGGASLDFEAEMAQLRLQAAALPLDAASKASTAEAVTGVVVIAAGVGGPDAVRQLLADLPAGFPRPVVLAQKIVGGQYDKLTRQMQRAAQMEVLQAEAGMALKPATIYVLGEGLDIGSDDNGNQFIAADTGLSMAAVRAGDSALLLLSGTEPGVVDLAMNLRWAGGLVLGQAPENCFDPAASQALVARGGETRSLAEMSRQLLQRWPV